LVFPRIISRGFDAGDELIVGTGAVFPGISIGGVRVETAGGIAVIFSRGDELPFRGIVGVSFMPDA
jgi:hypothetical protein